MHTFTLSDTQTGRKRTFDFYVHADEPAMHAYLDQHHPISEGWGDAMGATVVDGWHQDDVPELVGAVHVHQDDLSIETLVHEVTHIALTAYQQDCLKWDSRARAHINTSNEVLPSLIGGLMAEVALELTSQGYYRG